jgi:cytochrome oxidase assembly protein ShyY1
LNEPRGPGVVVTTLVVLICVGILCSLGVWQLHRKVWKENLIAAMTARLDQTPQPLPPPSDWSKLTQDTDEFRRVKFSAEFLPGQEALVYTPGSALRTDISGPGYFVFAPARLTDGSVIVVDRGFVPTDRKEAARNAPNGTIDIVGVLRWPEERNLFTPREEGNGNLWFVRDPAAMSAKLNWGAEAPFYVDQEEPVPPGGLPKPGKLAVHLRDDHLQYAITWFGLAAGLIGVYGWWLFGRVRTRRGTA